MKLLIARGDPPSLLAALLESRPRQLVLWHRMETDAAAESRRAVVKRLAEHLDAHLQCVAPVPAAGLQELPPPKGLCQSHLLLEAGIAARHLGCEVIIWPVITGMNPGIMSGVAQRALTVSALLELSDDDPPDGEVMGSHRSVTIETPFASLTTDELADLLIQKHAPLDLCWPCEQGGTAPCGNCAGCTCWQKAFRKVGVTRTVG